MKLWVGLGLCFNGYSTSKVMLSIIQSSCLTDRIEDPSDQIYKFTFQIELDFSTAIFSYVLRGCCWYMYLINIYFRGSDVVLRICRWYHRSKLSVMLTICDRRVPVYEAFCEELAIDRAL